MFVRSPIASLTGLRFATAISVVIHMTCCNSCIPPAEPPLEHAGVIGTIRLKLLKLGALGRFRFRDRMSLFFVLSGAPRSSCWLFAAHQRTGQLSQNVTPSPLDPVPALHHSFAR